MSNFNPKLEETIIVDFITSSPTTGAAIDADSTPTCAVYEDTTDTAIVTPTVVKRTSLTGNYRVPVVCTAANGFEAAKSYSVVISATVGSVAAKAIAANFMMRTRAVDDIATQVSLDTVDDFLDTEVAAIKAKTDNLPSDPADASDISGSFTTVNTKLDTIDDFLDTEVAAIKAKTDNLPSDPADASDVAASFTTVNTKLDTIDDFLDSEIAAIKTKTDQLTFTVANQLDVNALTIAAAQLTAIADAVFKRDWTAISGEAARSLLNSARTNRNRVSLTAVPGSVVVYKEDDTTIAWQAPLTTDATALPITGWDPT